MTKYMDDILIGGTSPEKVGGEAAAIWQAVNNAEIEISYEKNWDHVKKGKP